MSNKCLRNAQTNEQSIFFFGKEKEKATEIPGKNKANVLQPVMVQIGSRFRGITEMHLIWGQEHFSPASTQNPIERNM